MGQSKCFNRNNFIYECNDIDFLPKCGQACSCYLVNTHNMATHEAFDMGFHLKYCHLNCFIDKTVDRNHQHVSPKNQVDTDFSGHEMHTTVGINAPPS